MRYAVIGTGAIGGYYGGRLAKAGNVVHFLAHSDFDAMSEALTVDSCNGSFVIKKPNVYRSTAEMPEVDVVIVALKTINNQLLPEMLKPMLMLNPEMTIVLIQNGLCVEEDLARLIPGIQLVAGLAFICSTKIAPAHIFHQDYGSLTLANYSCRDTQIVERMAEEMNAAEVKTFVVEYNFGRWRKAIWNLPFNGLTVVRNADTQQLVNEEEPLVRSIMHEVVAIANALGVTELGQQHIDKNIEDTRNMKPYAPSMKVDFDHHRPMEIYYLYTRAIMEADRLNVPCPCLKELEKQLKEIPQ